MELFVDIIGLLHVLLIRVLHKTKKLLNIYKHALILLKPLPIISSLSIIRLSLDCDC